VGLTEFYLVRHPRPDVEAGLCYGWLDLPLLEPAAAAAARIRPNLPAHLATLPLWTSPATRCRELAAALHPRPQIDARLREMHFGAWEGQKWETIDRAALDRWAQDPADFAPPGGESARDVLTRLLSFLAEIASTPGQTAILVTHGGILRLLHAHARELPPERWTQSHFDHEAVLRIVGDPQKTQVQGLRGAWYVESVVTSPVQA
jgi:alpha-ribazole phosphatase